MRIIIIVFIFLNGYTTYGQTINRIYNANLTLSEHRAGSIRDELVNRFRINPERIEIKGYGESDLIVKEEEIDQADSKDRKEELYQQNRRTEIIILEMIK